VRRLRDKTARRPGRKVSAAVSPDCLQPHNHLCALLCCSHAPSAPADQKACRRRLRSAPCAAGCGAGGWSRRRARTGSGEWAAARTPEKLRPQHGCRRVRNVRRSQRWFNPQPPGPTGRARAPGAADLLALQLRQVSIVLLNLAVAVPVPGLRGSGAGWRTMATAQGMAAPCRREGRRHCGYRRRRLPRRQRAAPAPGR